MDIRFDGSLIRISFDGPPPLDELTLVRSLPYRKFNPGTLDWEVEYVTENYEALRRVVNIDHIPAPTARATRVDASKRQLILRLPQTHENVNFCRSIPDTKMWSTTNSAWHVKPTRRNVEFIKQCWPDIMWTPEALELVASTEAPPVESKAELERLKDIARNDYRFGDTTPYDHQLAAFAISREATAYGLFMEMGTGKTYVEIHNANYLHSRGRIQGMLVVCPKSIKGNWAREVETHLPHHAAHRTLIWQSGKTDLTEVQALIDEAKQGELVFFIMNIDALVTGRGFMAAELFVSALNVMMAVDESTRIKNAGAKRTKACVKLGRLASYRRIMTGTPVTQGPLDTFSQFQFLDPNILGFGSYYSFRNHFTIMGGYQNKQILKYVRLDELQTLISPYSYRVTKEQCLDLPEKVYRRIDVQLTKQQRAIYDDLAENLVTEVENIGTIAAPLVITLLLRFQQIIGGFVPHLTLDPLTNMPQTATAPVPGDNPKLEALLDFLEDTSEKVIIWAHFRPEIAIIVDALRAKYGDESTVELHGGVKDIDRQLAVDKFQRHPDCRFFVGQTETGGLGLTLTAATQVVYYSNSFSLESRQQSEDRAHRIGQTRHVTYTDILAENTIDTKLILPALRKKLNLANVITGDNLREWL